MILLTKHICDDCLNWSTGKIEPKKVIFTQNDSQFHIKLLFVDKNSQLTKDQQDIHNQLQKFFFEYITTILRRRIKGIK